MLDVHRLCPKLWQGANPPEGFALERAGFRVLVLCAEEHQASSAHFPGLLRVVHAPNDDDARPPTEHELAIAMDAARITAGHVARAERTLIVCHLGYNRSGLVAALTLRRLTGWRGEDCRRHVQAHRPGALGNPFFVELLDRLPGLRVHQPGQQPRQHEGLLTLGSRRQ